MKPGPIRTSIERASVVAAQAEVLRFGRDAVRLHTARHVYLATYLSVDGRGNRLIVESGVRLRGVRLRIRGDNNTVRVSSGTRMARGALWIEGNGCTISIGSGSTFEPGCKLAAVEDNSTITVGADCMFSEAVEVRTSDSHRMFDAAGQRINPAKDIHVGEHVWLGNGSMVLKGVRLADGTIVGARSVVTRSCTERSAVLAGVPARIVRKDVTWTR